MRDQPPQLQMVWPAYLLDAPSPVRLPPGYALRTYQPGDELRFCEVMALAGWPGWTGESLRPWMSRILPEGWFMAVHAELSHHRDGDGSPRPPDEHPFGGDFRWVACDPDRVRVGMAVSAVRRPADRRWLSQHPFVYRGLAAPR